MEENDSTSSVLTSEPRKPSYISLLEEIETLVKFLTKLNIAPNHVEETSDISEMETIFNYVTVNIDEMIEKMDFQKKSMVLVMVLNTIIRIATSDGSSVIMSRKPFQSMLKKISHCISRIPACKDFSPTCASDLMDSMLMNFVKDGFAEICFKRLLSSETISTAGNMLHNSHY